VRGIADYKNAQGQTCRIIEQTVLIAGQRVRATGTMCQQPDGRWTLIAEPTTPQRAGQR